MRTWIITTSGILTEVLEMTEGEGVIGGVTVIEIGIEIIEGIIKEMIGTEIGTIEIETIEEKENGPVLPIKVFNFYVD